VLYLLYRILLYYIVLYYILSYYIILYRIILYYISKYFKNSKIKIYHIINDDCVPAKYSLYSDYVINLMTGKSVFDSRLDLGLPSTTFKPSLGTTKLPICWVPKITFSKFKTPGAWSRSLACIKISRFKNVWSRASFLSRVNDVVNLYLGFIYTYEHNYQITQRKSVCFVYNISYSVNYWFQSLLSFSAVVVKCLYTSTPCVFKYTAITVSNVSIINIINSLTCNVSTLEAYVKEVNNSATNFLQCVMISGLIMEILSTAQFRWGTRKRF